MTKAIKTKNNTPVGAWFLLVLAIVYGVSPIDLVPDVPIIGWVDDLFVGAIATLNLAQQTLLKTQGFMYTMVNGIKWILILLALILVTIVALGLTAILK